MFEYTKEDLNIMAKELKFNRDTLEKVIRLIKILDFINTDSQIKEKLVLKGGTAINLSVLALPRLSVDIDLDYMENISREQMLLERKIITSELKRFFEMEDYVLSPKSKSRHSLDSFVINYINSAGINDNIKVEINYSLRSHLFECIHKKIKLKQIESNTEILMLNKFELFAAKINALLSRAMPRDLYDVYNVCKNNIFAESDLSLLRAAFVFYTAISQENIPDYYSLDPIENITLKNALAALQPVLHKGSKIELELYKKIVKIFVAKVIDIDDKEREFLDLFKQKIYKPELLFSDEYILKNIKNHPMVMWKLNENKIEKPINNQILN